MTTCVDMAYVCMIYMYYTDTEDSFMGKLT